MPSKATSHHPVSDYHHSYGLEVATSNCSNNYGPYPDSPAARGEPAASLLKYVNDRPGHDRRYAIDCGKISA